MTDKMTFYGALGQVWLILSAERILPYKLLVVYVGAGRLYLVTYSRPVRKTVSRNANESDSALLKFWKWPACRKWWSGVTPVEQRGLTVVMLWNQKERPLVSKDHYGPGQPYVVTGIPGE